MRKLTLNHPIKWGMINQMANPRRLNQPTKEQRNHSRLEQWQKNKKTNKRTKERTKKRRLLVNNNRVGFLAQLIRSKFNSRTALYRQRRRRRRQRRKREPFLPQTKVPTRQFALPHSRREALPSAIQTPCVDLLSPRGVLP